MRWILGTNKEIAIDNDQIQARRNYIQCVTGAEVSAWGFIQVNGPVRKKYLCCMSDDGIDGTFITAHIKALRKILCKFEFSSDKNLSSFFDLQRESKEWICL